MKNFVLLLLQSASIAVENVDNPNSRTQSKPQATTPAGKGRNQQAQSTTRPTNGQLQTFLGWCLVHWVPIAPSKANFKTLSQISQQSQPQATTPVGDVACSFWQSDQSHRGFKPTSNIFELVALKHLDGESWRINVRPNLLSSSYEATFPPPWRPQNFGVMKRIAKYCKILQIYANMFESLRLLQIGWLHGHRKHQKTLPSAGQRPLQLPARVRSTQKPSPKRFSTRATAAAAQI